MKNFYIEVDTIKIYVRDVNKLCSNNNKHTSYNTHIKTRAVRLLDRQETIEVKYSCWASLADEVIICMLKFAINKNDPHGI